MPSPPTCFAFSNLWKRCMAAPPCHCGHVLFVALIPLPDLIVQSACPLLWGKWLRSGLTASSSAASLGGLRVTISPGLLCGHGPPLSQQQCNTRPAFLAGGRPAELGVPAGEGGPWRWLGLCWARPSNAARLRELGDAEEWEAVGDLCSAPLWASDKSRAG